MTTSPAAGRVTSWYGKRTPPRKPDGSYGTGFHRGVDIAGPAGSPVVAPEAGVVSYIGRTSLRGLYVIIDHGRYRTLHQHLDEVTVYQGQRVAEDQQQVGVMGTTGGVARHLHTEVHDGTTPIDPRPWYAARGVTLGVRSRVAGVTIRRRPHMFVTRYGSSGYYLVAGDRMAPINQTSYTKLAAAGIPAVALDNAEVVQLRNLLTAETTTVTGGAVAPLDVAALAKAIGKAIADEVATRLKA